MKKGRLSIVVYSIVLIALVGCQASAPLAPGEGAALPLPTLRPTAVLLEPAVIDAETPVTPTPFSKDEAGSTIIATAEVAPTPGPTIEPRVSLSSLSSTAISGGTLVLSGQALLGQDQSLEAALLAPDGRLIAATPITPGEFNSWQALLMLPQAFAGQARVVVTVFDGNGQAVIQDAKPVVVAPDTEQDRHLVVYRPSLAGPTKAVSGYYLFFDGVAMRPAGFRVAIEILDDDCQRRVNRQSYALRGSGYWQAFIVVPEETSGSICAVVSFGDPGTAERREIYLPLEVLPVGAKQRAGVLIGNPPPGDTLQAGRSAKLYGTAYETPNHEVLLTLLLADGTIAATETADVNRYGYWEADMLIPVELEGEALLRALIGPPGQPLATDELLLAVEKSR